MNRNAAMVSTKRPMWVNIFSLHICISCLDRVDSHDKIYEWSPSSLSCECWVKRQRRYQTLVSYKSTASCYYY